MPVSDTTHDSCAPSELSTSECPTFESCSSQDSAGRVQALVAKYIAERDQALRLLDVRTIELQAAREELLQLKQQVKALSWTFKQPTPKSTDGIVSLERGSLSSYYSGPPSFSETPDLTQPGVLGRLAFLEGCTLTNSQQGGVHSTTSVALPTPPQSPLRYDSHLPSAPGVKDKTIGASKGKGALFGDKTGIASPSGSSRTTVPHHELNSIAALRLLNDNAAKAQSIEHLEWFYKKALATPCNDRTLPEQYIILEWGRTIAVPKPSASPPAPISHPPSFGSENIFVDSSGWGIGFVYNGRWLAWQFKSGWKTEGRDNNWSEMIAVELGLEVAISAGLTHRKVAVKSDNTGVIQALTTEKSRHPKHPEVIRRIMALIKKHGIVLDISWVPTHENLADDPSRGKFLRKELLFPGSFPVPPYLAPFVSSPINLHSLS